MQDRNLRLMHGNYAKNHSGGKAAKAIENQIAKLSSDLFLWAALGRCRISNFKMPSKKQHCLVHWPVGGTLFTAWRVYSKIAKTEGRDQEKTSLWTG